MASKNDITGDEIKSKSSTKAYEDNYDRIFGKKKNTDEEDYPDNSETLQDSLSHKPATDQFDEK